MNKVDVEFVITLQKNAYDLLMWLNDKAWKDPYVLSPEMVDTYSNASQCAKWIHNNCNKIPKSLVRKENIDELANLLSSFFHTSFHIRRVESDKKIICARLEPGADEGEKYRRGGRQKNLSSKNVMALSIKHLASFEGISISEKEAKDIANNPNLEDALLLWSYVWELGRRVKKPSKGPALHKIWRKIEPTTRKNLNTDDAWKARTLLVNILLEKYVK